MLSGYETGNRVTMDGWNGAMKYLHTMVRVKDIDASLKFYCDALGMQEMRRNEYQQGRFTLIFPRRARNAGSRDRTDLQLGCRGVWRGAQLRPSGLCRR